MAGTGRKWFTLADAVFVVVLCGLAMAWAVLDHRGVDPAFVFIPFVFTMVFWFLLRHQRTAVNCRECGARFIPIKYTRPLFDCAICGAPQPALARSLRRRKIVFWLIVPLFPILGVGAIFFAAVPAPVIYPTPGFRLIGLPIAGFGAAAALAALVGLGASRRRLASARDRPCESCGKILTPPPTDSTCPVCLRKKQSLHAASREHAQAVPAIFLILVVAVVVVGSLLVSLGFLIVRSRGLGGVLPPVFLMLGVACFLGYIARNLAWTLILAGRRKCLLKEETAIARARRFAGVEGTIVRDGPTTVWFSGPVDPTAMLHEESAAASERFQAFVKEPFVVAPPRLILAFHDMEGLSRFIRWVFPNLISPRPIESVTVDRPLDVLALYASEGSGPYRDPRTVARSVAIAAHVDRFYGEFPALWVTSGVVQALQAPDRAAAVLLNRRMIVALSSGAAWPDGPHSIPVAKLMRLMKRVDAPRASVNADVFGDQSWSVVEYLMGELAPDSRRESFLAFLKDKTARDRVEEAFFRHFGHGFATLNESWREWVLEQGIGPDLPPSPRVRAALATRLLPLIGDRSGPRKDRVEAVREWRRAGYALGAQVLIDLLRDPGDIPKDELVWALAMASGKLLGDDPDAWQDWYNELPGECKDGAAPAAALEHEG